MKHGMFFRSAVPEMLVKVHEKMDRGKCRAVLEENMLEGAQDLRHGAEFDHPKYVYYSK